MNGKLFSPKDFIHFESLVRTTNLLESYHKILNFRIDSPNNGLYVLAHKLFQEAVQSRCTVMNMVNGNAAMEVDTKYVWKNMVFGFLWD